MPELSPLERARRFSAKIDEANNAGRTLGTDVKGNVPSVGPVESVPDAEIIATLVAYGMPLVNAKAVEHSPQMRFIGLRFWSDVDAMGKGDPEARERVDHCRDGWQRMRRDEVISG